MGRSFHYFQLTACPLTCPLPARHPGRHGPQPHPPRRPTPGRPACAPGPTTPAAHPECLSEKHRWHSTSGSSSARTRPTSSYASACEARGVRVGNKRERRAAQGVRRTTTQAVLRGAASWPAQHRQPHFPPLPFRRAPCQQLLPPTALPATQPSSDPHSHSVPPPASPPSLLPSSRLQHRLLLRPHPRHPYLPSIPPPHPRPSPDAPPSSAPPARHRPPRQRRRRPGRGRPVRSRPRPRPGPAWAQTGGRE